MIHCTCPTYQGIKVHWDTCPNDLMPPNAEILAFHAQYGLPENLPDKDETRSAALDSYNTKFYHFIRGFRAGRA